MAGNGVEGYSGDGGPAVLASLNRPRGIALDPAGNLYIADTGNSSIRIVNTSGVIKTVAGQSGVYGDSGDGGAATSARRAVIRTSGSWSASAFSRVCKLGEPAPLASRLPGQVRRVQVRDGRPGELTGATRARIVPAPVLCRAESLDIRFIFA